MQADTHPNKVLGSWKEIAFYFGKGVRTVQRWEREFGLPVKRPRQRAKGVVYADPEELDRWLATNWTARAVDSSAATRKRINPVNGSGLPPVEGPSPPPIDALRLPELSKNIQLLRELRDANRSLVHELSRLVHGTAQQCASLCTDGSCAGDGVEKE